MGLLSDIFGFIEDLTSSDSYYKGKSVEWCDKFWSRMRNVECGEVRICQISDKGLQSVVFEYGIEGIFQRHK